MLRIAHVSDIHIRTLKYHSEYRAVFDDLYGKLEALKPDLIVNTGDTCHSKTNVSPEQYDVLGDHVRRVSEIAPYHIILGNHDLNLMNLERQDAITPVVTSIGSPRVHLHKMSGLVSLPEHGLNLWIFSLADTERYPNPSQWREHPGAINVGLFHGSIAQCLTDGNFRMTQTEYDQSLFEGLDYVLMGDIHKQQFFGERRAIGYAGSLIQQNFGEELDKGFLVWDIESKTRHSVTSVHLTGSRKFYTVRLRDDLSVPDVSVAEGSRVRISPPRSLTLVEQKEAEREVRKKFRPHDVITLSAVGTAKQAQERALARTVVDDPRQLHVQERLIREFLRDRSVSDSVLRRVLDLNARLQVIVDQKEDVTRNVSWRLNRICWDNLFNYGSGNVLDFTGLRGVTGIFAPNAAGKSNIIDALLETLYDSTTRGVTKNIHLINDNKDVASMVADVTVNGHDYVIERSIERIKYGKRKGEEKEWGKTACGFFMTDDVGEHVQLTGVSRPETERAISSRIGSYSDLMLTSVIAQWNPLDIIACKETRRREILCRFFDLDVFEQKALMARDEARSHYERLKEFDEDQLKELLKKLRSRVDASQLVIREKELEADRVRFFVSTLNDEIVILATQKSPVEGSSSRSSVLKRVERARAELMELEGQLTVKREELSSVDTGILKLQKLEKKFDLVAHEDASRRFGEVQREIEVSERLRLELSRSHSDNSKRLRLLDEVPCGDEFPHCKFLIDAFGSKSRVPALEDELRRLDDSVKRLISEREQLRPKNELLDAYKQFVSQGERLRSRRDNVNLQVENVSLRKRAVEADIGMAEEELKQMARVAETVSRNRALDEQIASVRERKSAHDLELRRLQDELSELHRSVGSDVGLCEKAAERVDRLREVKETCAAYEHYVDAMGKDGIAYRILAQKLPLINEEINKILANSADFSVMIEDDPEEKSIRIYLQYGQYKSRLIELGSGAEKMIASVALRVALLNVSNLPKSNMFVIDEGFGKLDPKNLENVQRMFDYLRDAFDHVLVVSHLDVMKDMVDSSIEITTDGEGYAHVEVGG